MSIRGTAGVVAANALATLCLLALLEGAARLFVDTEPASPLQGEAALRYRELLQPDPLLFWTLRPEVEIDGRPFTNAHGLRDRPVEPPRPGELRMLALGESTTFGDGVARDERYTEQLMARLPTLGGRRLRTINAGVPGYTLFQGVAYLRLRGLALEPDAVAIYFGYNDFLKVGYRTARDGEASGRTDRELFAQRQRPLARLLWSLRRWSALARWALRDDPDGAVAQGSRARVPEADRRALLDELRQLCAEQGIALVVVIPWYLHFDLHIPLLRELRDAPDVVLVDLPWRLRGIPRPPHFLDTLHPSPAGHRRIAAEIASVLQREAARFRPGVPR